MLYKEFYSHKIFSFNSYLVKTLNMLIIYRVFGTIFFIAIALMVYGLSLVMRDNISFDRFNLAYYFLVRHDSTLHSFPILQTNQGDQRYFYESQSAVSPTRISIAFQPQSSPQTVVEKYSNYCRQQGYRILSEDINAANIVCSTPAYDIWIMLADISRDDMTVIFESKSHVLSQNH